MHNRKTGDKSYNNSRITTLSMHGFVSSSQSVKKRGREGKSRRVSAKIKPKTTERIQTENQRYHNMPSKEPKVLYQDTEKTEETTIIGI